jgi:hypothetical protein
VFNTIFGIPAHPLIIHVAVIFIPLLVLGAIVYAAWPPFRAKIGWAVLAVAIIAPLAGGAAKLSGQDLKTQLIDKKLASPEFLVLVVQHNSYGNHTFWWTLALAILTLVMLAYNWQASRSASTGADANTRSGAAVASPAAIRIGSTVVMVVVGGIVGYYVFRTGDTGAHMVWQGL